MTSGTAKAHTRTADLEAKRLNGHYELTAKSSFGQEFIMDLLNLRGCGQQRMKLVVNNKEEFCQVFKMALEDGLIILGINIDTTHEVG